MSNKTLRMLGLIITTLILLFVGSLIGYFVAVQFAVAYTKTEGKVLDYIPEKIVKLETDFVSPNGIHFRGKSGKLFRCDGAKNACEAMSSEPPRYKDKKPFKEAQRTYRKFSPPAENVAQIVFSHGKGLFGHQTVRQYALTEDGKVIFWMYSGNEMGDSFPFWHLNNLTPLLIGTIAGFFVGFILSVIIWFVGFPRKV